MWQGGGLLDLHLRPLPQADERRVRNAREQSWLQCFRKRQARRPISGTSRPNHMPSRTSPYSLPQGRRIAEIGERGHCSEAYLQMSWSSLLYRDRMRQYACSVPVVLRPHADQAKHTEDWITCFGEPRYAQSPSPSPLSQSQNRQLLRMIFMPVSGRIRILLPRTSGPDMSTTGIAGHSRRLWFLKYSR